MAEARDISSQAELGDKALGPTSLLCAPSQQQCVPSQQQIDVSQGSVCSSGDGGSFECNICLELAHDPVVTLCGHLFCWPCLYRWLHLHSASQECPVCKALVKQETLVPVYGRGNPDSSDPRKKSVSELSVPQRPPGQRPEVARPPDFQSPQQDFNVVAVPSSPVATARPSNFRLSTGFGLFPSLFGQQVHGAPDAIGFGPGYPFGWPIGWHNAHLHSHPHAAHLIPDRQQEAVYSQIFLVLLLLVALCILFI